MTKTKKWYFASDFHLGVDARLTSKEREKQIVRWLEKIRHDAAAIYLVGDVFDFWYEYKTAIPKGYARLLGKLAELRDDNIPIYFFTGNHDMWMFRYLDDEMGIPIYRNPIVEKIAGRKFFIGHGDGLGPGDYGYKFIKKIFANKFCQWLFGWVHPDIGIALANFWSGRSRGHQDATEEHFLGEDKEWLLAYCKRKLETIPVDFFIFGHRHLPIDYTLNAAGSRYINLGEWLHFNSYAVFDGETLQHEFFETEPVGVRY